MTKLPIFFSPGAAPGLPRRTFLRYTGAASVGVALLLAGCKDDDDDPVNPAPASSNGQAVGLGSGDTQLINLLQAGKQISAELLRRLIATPPAGLGGADLALVRAIGEQQTVHRDVLKAAANAARTVAGTPLLNLPELTLDFSTVVLTDSASALTAALTLLNTLIAGAAGALRHTSRSTMLTLLGQILSVDARHAATLAALLPGGALNDPQETPGPDARNRALRPSETATALNNYLASGSRIITASLA